MNTFTEIFSQDVLIDSHCHCSSIESELAKVVNEAITEDVNYIVDIATDLATSKQTYENYLAFPENILPTAGLDPELIIPGSELYDPGYDEGKIQKELTELEKMLSDQKYSAIGECGLDYYWLEKGSHSPEQKDNSKRLQKILFQGQIDLAQKFKLPMTIHSRASEDDCLEMLKPFANKTNVVFHSFTGNYRQAKQVLEMGFKLGINGIVTYRSAQELRNVYQQIIGDNMFTTPKELYDLGLYLETDAPLLIPATTTYSERFNSPKQIRIIWDFLLRTFNNGQKTI